MCYKPLVSIIIPVYNVGELLKTCLDSVIGQTYENLEIIVINDGSTDNSLTYISHLLETDERIRVFHQHNQGAAASRNFGIEQSTGEYLFFLDADDTISHDAIAYLLDLMQQTNTQVGVSGVAYYDKSGKIYSKSSFTKGVYSTKQIIEMMYTRHTDLCLIGGKMVTRQCLGMLRFIPGQLVEDAYFVPNVYKQAQTIVLSPKINYHYYTGRQESASNDISVKKLKDHLGTLQKVRELFKDDDHLKTIISARIFVVRGNYLKNSFLRKSKDAFNYAQSYPWTGFSSLAFQKQLKFLRLFTVIVVAYRLKLPFLWYLLDSVNNFCKNIKMKFLKFKRNGAVFKRGYKQVKRVGYFADSAYRYFLFPKTNVVYIDNPKVASTSIKEVLVANEGDDIFALFSNDIHIHCQKHYMNDRNGFEKLPYFSFAFVRNPFERVVSTYKNMYNRPQYEWTTFKTYFFGYFEKDKGFDYFVKKGPVRISDKWADTHLISQHLLVYDDNGKSFVDFIGRFENLTSDWQIVSDKVNLPELPQRNQTEQDDWRAYYTKELAQMVYERYRKDFEMFGYEDEYDKLLQYLEDNKPAQ